MAAALTGLLIPTPRLQGTPVSLDTELAPAREAA
jgi:hypothetical protein